MRRLRALVAALALMAAAPALAQERAGPFYVGVTFGQAEWRPGCPNSASCDANDLALRVLAGYTFNRNFAAEAGFHNLGKAQGTNATIKANAWEALLVATLPVTGLVSAYGQLGGYRGNARAVDHSSDRRRPVTAVRGASARRWTSLPSSPCAATGRAM